MSQFTFHDESGVRDALLKRIGAWPLATYFGPTDEVLKEGTITKGFTNIQIPKWYIEQNI